MLNLSGNCTKCKELVFQECENLVIATANLSTGPYYYFLENARGKVFKGMCSCAYGVTTISKDDVPAGLFSVYGDSLMLQLSTDPNGADPVTIQFGYDNYTCIKVTFSNE